MSRTPYPLSFISLRLSFSQRSGGSWKSMGNTKEYKENVIRNKNERDSQHRKMTGKKCGADGEAPGLSAFSLMMKDCPSRHLMALLCNPRDGQRLILDCERGLFSPLYSQAA